MPKCKPHLDREQAEAWADVHYRLSRLHHHLGPGAENLEVFVRIFAAIKKGLSAEGLEPLLATAEREAGVDQAKIDPHRGEEYWRGRESHLEPDQTPFTGFPSSDSIAKAAHLLGWDLDFTPQTARNLILFEHLPVADQASWHSRWIGEGLQTRELLKAASVMRKSLDPRYAQRRFSPDPTIYKIAIGHMVTFSYLSPRDPSGEPFSVVRNMFKISQLSVTGGIVEVDGDHPDLRRFGPLTSDRLPDPVRQALASGAVTPLNRNRQAFLHFFADRPESEAFGFIIPPSLSESVEAEYEERLVTGTVVGLPDKGDRLGPSFKLDTGEVVPAGSVMGAHIVGIRPGGILPVSGDTPYLGKPVRVFWDGNWVPGVIDQIYYGHPNKMIAVRLDRRIAPSKTHERPVGPKLIEDGRFAYLSLDSAFLGHADRLKNGNPLSGYSWIRIGGGVRLPDGRLGMIDEVFARERQVWLNSAESRSVGFEDLRPVSRSKPESGIKVGDLIPGPKINGYTPVYKVLVVDGEWDLLLAVRLENYADLKYSTPKYRHFSDLKNLSYVPAASEARNLLPYLGSHPEIWWNDNGTRRVGRILTEETLPIHIPVKENGGGIYQVNPRDVYLIRWSDPE